MDSGIGGAVADVVGKRMRELGAHHQVLAVTHLPQVAARAHQQFSVSKSVIDGQTQSQLQLLDGEQRVDEIARMLGGAEISLATRYHAQDMLGRALV